ncbi:MAG TPA: nucleotidyltransferase [Minicystis sp.]|nr:nucleotidyltransferase [Minicystis sp.]
MLPFMVIDPPQHWIELVGLLVRHRVRFLLVGAHAVAAHGQARVTRDIDFFIDRTPENARRLAAAIRDFGFRETANATAEQMTIPERMVRLGADLRIDIMNAISGVTFAEAWAHKKRTVFAGHRIWVIGKEELLRNKLASGRPKDMADVALIREVSLERVTRPRKAPRGRPSSASSRRPRPR